jgi:hypothetical protein
MFPAPVSFRGKAGKLMLKLVALVPRPRLTKTMAAPSRRVKLSEPPSSGHGVLGVVLLDTVPAPIAYDFSLIYHETGRNREFAHTRIDTFVVRWTQSIVAPSWIPKLCMCRN